MMMTPEVKLMNGLELPGIGFGTYKAEEKSFEAVCAALDAGSPPLRPLRP